MFSMLLEPMTEDMQRIVEAWEEENFDALLELVHKYTVLAAIAAYPICSKPCKNLKWR